MTRLHWLIHAGRHTLLIFLIGLWGHSKAMADEAQSVIASKNNSASENNISSENNNAATQVRVGIYPFAPFAEFSEHGELHGMSAELMDILNQAQNTFEFVAVAVSPKRRYQAYQQNEVDAFFYENLNWGWHNIDILSSQPYQSGGERYITLAQRGRDQSYFDRLSERHLLGILGYHYGFANFNADESYLRDHYQITLTWDNDKLLQLLQRGNGDIAIITEAYWARFIRQQPELKDHFLVSERYDQTYQHSILMRPQLISQAQLDQLSAMLKQHPAFQQLLQRYGISLRQ